MADQLLPVAVQVEVCCKCDKQDFCGPGGGTFWGPWFYCATHDAELSAQYEEDCKKRERSFKDAGSYNK